MSNHIIETIGRWGVKTTPYQYRRETPRPGDIIEFEESLRRYPVSYAKCRIASIDKDDKRMSIVDSMGSAFLNSDGEVSISGGPFFGLPLEAIEPTIHLHDTILWNWGDNSPGAGQGVEYRIPRPIFRALAHPDDYPTRYAESEESARHGGMGSHAILGSEFEVIHAGPPSRDGNRLFQFKLGHKVEPKLGRTPFPKHTEVRGET